MTGEFDIIVIGGGHAGCEAAMAAANMGSSVLLMSPDIHALAKMSCNPAVGGIAKGQIVREIDALGGYTGLVTDAATLQFRMLNRSKGPAMWSPRAQCDKRLFSETWLSTLLTNSRLSIYADFAASFLLENSRICGVKTFLLPLCHASFPTVFFAGRSIERFPMIVVGDKWMISDFCMNIYFVQTLFHPPRLYEFSIHT